MAWGSVNTQAEYDATLEKGGHGGSPVWSRDSLRGNQTDPGNSQDILAAEPKGTGANGM